MAKRQVSVPAWTSGIFIGAAAFLYLSTSLDKNWMRFCHQYGSFYLTFLLVALWLGILVRAGKLNNMTPRTWIQEHGWGLFFSFTAAAFIFISVQPYFRVLADETNLLAISKSMLEERTIVNATQGKWYYHNFHPLQVEFPKRPLLFPFLLSGLHTLLGYRTFNPFVLNFLVLFALFSTVFAFVKKRWGMIPAVSAVLLAASQPVVIQCATSGGFELLFLLFAWLSFLALEAYLRDPSDIRLQWLWIHLLMLAQTRYEGSLFLGVVLAFLVLLKKIRWEGVRQAALLYSLTPLIFLPTYWQRFFFPFGHQTQAGQSPFSLSYFPDNVRHFMETFIRYDFYLPYATLLHGLALISASYFLYLFFKKKWAEKGHEQVLLVISAACLAGHTLILLSYHHASIAHPSVTRYYVLQAFALSLLAWMFLMRVTVKFRSPFAVLIAAVTVFLLYHPVSIKNEFLNSQTLPREYRVTLDFFKKLDNPNILILSDRPGMYTVHHYGAVKMGYANQHHSTILKELKRHLYEEVYVIQQIRYQTNRPTPETHLSPVFKLEPVLELQKEAATYTRISRVKL